MQFGTQNKKLVSQLGKERTSPKKNGLHLTDRVTFATQIKQLRILFRIFNNLLANPWTACQQGTCIMLMCISFFF